MPISWEIIVVHAQKCALCYHFSFFNWFQLAFSVRISSYKSDHSVYNVFLTGAKTSFQHARSTVSCKLIDVSGLSRPCWKMKLWPPDHGSGTQTIWPSRLTLVYCNSQRLAVWSIKDLFNQLDNTISFSYCCCAVLHWLLWDSCCMQLLGFCSPQMISFIAHHVSRTNWTVYVVLVAEIRFLMLLHECATVLCAACLC